VTAAGPSRPRGGLRRLASGSATLLAVLVVWFALVAPDHPDGLVAAAFLRIPLEGLVLAGLALALRGRVRGRVLAGFGVLLGLLTVLKLLDLGSFAVVDRPFDPLTDWDGLGAALGFLRRSAGGPVAALAVAGAVVLAVALLVVVPLAVVRLGRLAASRRRTSTAVAAALAVTWAVTAALGARVAPGAPLAAAQVVQYAAAHAGAAEATLRDWRGFDTALASDRFGGAGNADLAGLRGKDVLVVFVESYGRVAVQGPSSTAVQGLLDEQGRGLRAHGWSARSAFLTSPTFGGVSWLAHATLQSGVWVDSQSKYDQLVASRHTTLATAFRRAGWRTAALVPSDRGAWPAGHSFYDYDQVLDGGSLGYAGPPFGFSLMPDQYALEAFHRLEAASGNQQPLMAEVDLASSHGPWAPQPVMLDWGSLGNGSVFDGVQARAQSAQALWQHRQDVPAAYMTSIEYSLTALVQYIERYGNDNLVVLVLGDHQPATIVSGHDGNHDVPVTVVARDPSVTRTFAQWGWQEGLRPAPAAPVWRMDAFRDRFLGAFSTPVAEKAPPATAGRRP
jgi:hypothetical protein